MSTLQATPRDAACRTEGQDGVAVSFLVGLFHCLQHASVTRRPLINVSANRRSHRGSLRVRYPDATTLPSFRLCLVCSGVFSGGHRRGALDDNLDSLSASLPDRKSV